MEEWDLFLLHTEKPFNNVFIYWNVGLLLRLAERTEIFKILSVNVDVKICVSKKFNLWKNAD